MRDSSATSTARRWPDLRRSLYGRALLTVLVGIGAVVGAVVVQSYRSGEAAIERLLDDRMERAATCGSHVEDRLLTALGLLEDEVRWGGGEACLATRDPEACARVAAGLTHRYETTLLNGGAFLLGLDGRPLVAVPDGPEVLARALDLAPLVRRAVERDGPANTALVTWPRGTRRFVAFVAPLRGAQGALMGFVGGLLAPAEVNVLGALKLAPGSGTLLDVVDTEGVVVASSSPNRIFVGVDHERALAGALAGRRQFRSLCHDCHESAPRPAVERTILAFAPLPTLDLGMAVRQPEAIALDLAHALDQHMVVLGFATACLFLVFAWASVRSVVRPLARLTQAVRRVEETHEPLALPPFGHDEAGELAHALERWQRRTHESLEDAERHREALRAEVASNEAHLATLRQIAEGYAARRSLSEIVQRGVEALTESLALDVGTLRLVYRNRSLVAHRGLTTDEAEVLRGVCEALRRDRGEVVPAPTRGRDAVSISVFDERLPTTAGELRTLVAAQIVVPEGLTLSCVLGSREGCQSIDERWLYSVLHQIVTSAAGRLLRQEALLRQELQREYLGRVLGAQEAERQRVARDLHDTVAQDVAAQRLEIERLAAQTGDPTMGAALARLEAQSRDALETVRRILADLRPPALESMGFAAALQASLDQVRERHGLRVTLSFDGVEGEPPASLALPLFRIFQECLHNVVQHARASHVFVTFAVLDDRVALQVEDDGVGFDRPAPGGEQPAGARHPQLGLLGMEERARLVGGRLTISSAPGEGTCVDLVVPLAGDARADASVPPGLADDDPPPRVGGAPATRAPEPAPRPDGGTRGASPSAVVPPAEDPR